MPPLTSATAGSVLESIGDHVVRYDREWRYVMVNSAAERVLGRSRDELIGRSIWSIFPDAVGNPYYRALHQSMETQSVVRHEHYYPPFDRWFVNHIFPSVEGVTVVTTDVTDIKRAALASELDARRLQAVADAVPTLLAFIDCDLTYRLVNRAYAEWFGIDTDRFIGKSVRDMLGDESFVAIEPHVRRALAGETTALEMELPYPNKGPRWVELRYLPHRGTDRSVAGIVALAIDVHERKRAEIELREARDRLSIATDAAGLGIFEWFPGRGDGRWENARMYEIFARDPRAGPLSFAAFVQTVHSDDVSRLPQAGSRQDTRTDFDCRVAVPGRGWRRMRIASTLKAAADATPERWIGVVEDITEQAEREAALLRVMSERTLLLELEDAVRHLADPLQVQRVLVERIGRHFGATRCAFAEIDPSEHYADVVYDYVAGVRSLAGRHRLVDYGAALIAELRAGRTLLVADSRHDTRLDPAARAAFEAIQTRSLLCVPLVKAGHFIAVLVLHHRQPHAYGVEESRLLEQIAERTWFSVETARATSALRESRDVLALAMRGGRMGAWSRDLRSGAVWWSAELASLLGVPVEQLEGTDGAFLARVAEADRAALAAAIDAAVADRTDYRVEFRMRHADGADRWIDGRGRAVYAADGAPVMLYGIGIDVTERRAAEESLQRLNQELRDTDRRRNEFLATLSHELRNPLAPIRHGLSLLLHPAADPALRADAIAVIDRQAMHMARLVDDLLDVSRISQGKLVLRRGPVRVDDALRAAVDAVRGALENCGHRLIVDDSCRSLVLEADAARLTQMLTNLLNNAVKYTPAPGTVRIGALRDAQDVVFWVEDDGIGLSPEDLDRVFELFTQLTPGVDHAGGGLGIGLALVRRLAELHGGSVRAISAGRGKGCRFELRIPIGSGIERNEQPRSPAGRSPIGPGIDVLVADDNRDAAETLALLLRLSGHTVRVAHDGADAVESTAQSMPVLAILDIGMPHVSGYEAAERIRKLPGGSDVLLVALTGWGQAEHRQRALEAGFDRHLTKPIDPTALDELLREAARRIETSAT